ncbi:MAG: protein kinase [Proteobacteria bacterium]|nr:protein kinase [Pseudomonadota bacterium]
MIGSVIEKYEVLEKIGEGGMATVYRGRHTTLNRTVAIKVMHPHLTSSEKNRERFRREARAIESLAHDNILRIYDYSGPDSEKCFIVTEFIQGPTLRELLDDVGAMMPEPAALVARELCCALQTAHIEGIVHRDIKPENIMFDAEGRVKLMDFGIARIADDSHVTMTGALVGSPAYMSPEQATGEDVDLRSDIFALGTVLYRMVTGTLPFRGGNPSVVLKNIIDTTYDDPVERVPSLDPAVASVISKCLTRTADERYADTDEIRAELDGFLRSVAIDPEEPGQWSLDLYLNASDEYEDRLQPWLIERLVTRGRTEAGGGQTANALRTFNRVLTLDEDNEEVVTIIESMRPPLVDEPRRSGILLWIAPVLIAVAAIVALTLQSDRFAPEPTAAAEAPALRRVSMVPMPVLGIPEPLEVVVAPAPEPTPEEHAPAVVRPAPEPLEMEAVAIVEAAPEPTPEALQEPVLEGIGGLKVTAADGFLTFRVDGGKSLFTPTPEHLQLDAGDHTIEVLGSGTQVGYSKTVRVLPDARETLVLQPRYKPSTVKLTGFPLGSVYYVDGIFIGSADGTVRITLDEFKTYSISVEFNGQTIVEEGVTRGLTGTGVLDPGGERLIPFPGD